MSTIGLFAAIFSSMLCGYVLADLQGGKRLPRLFRIYRIRFLGKRSLTKDSLYYGALTSLLNEKADSALDTFISSMPVNGSTLDMHLALAGLWRRRGEFDRALKVHQSLLSRPSLPVDKIHHVQLELAYDFLRSGLYDRAEAILKELLLVSGLSKQTRKQASVVLLEIYQDLGEWLSAIEVADTLTEKKFSQEPDQWRRLQAQFSCELAHRAMKQAGREDTVITKLRNALRYDPNCVRANLLQAEFSLAYKEYDTALSAIRRIPNQNKKAVCELVSPLLRCYPNELEHGAVLVELRELFCLQPSVSLMLSISQLLLEGGAESEAQSLWLDCCKALPELESLQGIISAMLSVNEESVSESLLVLESWLRKQQHYQCEHCGFELSAHTWRCPSCHTWESIWLKVAPGYVELSKS